MSACPFQKFKNIFGVPGTGAHQYRLLDVAIVDYILTIALAYTVSRVSGFPLVLSTILMFVIGIVLHWLFGLQTSAVRFLGLKC